MRTSWQLLVGLAVVLPLGGYVAGSLTASADEEPPPREVIVLREAPPQPRAPGSTLTPVPEETVPVVSPVPDRLDDDRDRLDDRDDGDDRDDDGDDGDDD